MRNWLRDHGLLLANVLLFVAFFFGMTATGYRVSNNEQLEHGQSAESIGSYLTSGDFFEATFENWESEFLQMGMYVVLTAYLFQRGSSESETRTSRLRRTRTRETGERPRRALAGPRAVVWSLRLYENSLSIASSCSSSRRSPARRRWRKAYSEEQLARRAAVTAWQYLGTSQFWFESFQNWQSEFLAVAVIVGASVYLRERGSAESKAGG